MKKTMLKTPLKFFQKILFINFYLKNVKNIVLQKYRKVFLTESPLK